MPSCPEHMFLKFYVPMIILMKKGKNCIGGKGVAFLNPKILIMAFHNPHKSLSWNTMEIICFLNYDLAILGLKMAWGGGHFQKKNLFWLAQIWNPLNLFPGFSQIRYNNGNNLFFKLKVVNFRP